MLSYAEEFYQSVSQAFVSYSSCIALLTLFVVKPLGSQIHLKMAQAIHTKQFLLINQTVLDRFCLSGDRIFEIVQAFNFRVAIDLAVFLGASHLGKNKEKGHFGWVKQKAKAIEMGVMGRSRP